MSKTLIELFERTVQKAVLEEVHSLPPEATGALRESRVKELFGVIEKMENFCKYARFIINERGD